MAMVTSVLWVHEMVIEPELVAGADENTSYRPKLIDVVLTLQPAYACVDTIRTTKQTAVIIHGSFF
jgi:hypothetical protein